MHRLVKASQQVLLLFGQVDGCLDDDAAEQVARRSAADWLDALLPQSEHASRLRLGRHLELYTAAERGHLDHTSECCNDEAHRYFAGKVGAVALEDRVLANSDFGI